MSRITVGHSIIFGCQRYPGVVFIVSKVVALVAVHRDVNAHHRPVDGVCTTPFTVSAVDGAEAAIHEELEVLLITIVAGVPPATHAEILDDLKADEVALIVEQVVDVCLAIVVDEAQAKASLEKHKGDLAAAIIDLKG